MSTWTLDSLAGISLVNAGLWSEPMSERELIQRAREGDVEAFESLYRNYGRRVYALCLRIVADPSRAEDLTQEAFVRAWQKLDTFRGQSAFSTWLHRLTVNLALGWLRSESRRRERDLGGEGLRLVPDPAPQHEAGRTIDLERAIAGLPPQARIVFVLHDVEGWRHDEIAAEMGIAVGTSKAHLHRARRALRKALER